MKTFTCQLAVSAILIVLETIGGLAIADENDSIVYATWRMGFNCSTVNRSTVGKPAKRPTAFT